MGYASCQMGIANNKVDLLQQTPGDKPIGDLLGNIGGRNFIIEFKRNRKLLNTEISKDSKSFLLKKVLESEMLLISKKCHFIAFFENVDLLVNPYLYLNSIYQSDFQEPFSQDVFFKMLVEKQIGADKEEINKYTRFLSTYSKPSSSTVLVNYLAGRKPLVIDISDGYSLERKLEMEIKIEKAPAKNIQKQKGMEM